MSLRPQVHREHPPEQVIVGAPAAGDLRAERGRGPGVHHVRIAGEPAGLAALVLRVPGRRVRCRVDGQRRVGRRDRDVVARLAGRVQRVPDRDRHPEVTLTADQPVARQAIDPVLVAGAHVRRVPGEFPPAGQQRGAQTRVPAAVPDVPLPGGHDLQRHVALLVELHRVLHRLGIAAQVPRLAQHPGHPLPGRLRREAGQLLVGGTSPGAVDPGRRPGQQPAVAADHWPGRQLQVTPPGHVGRVPEGAHHRDPGALPGLGQPVREDRHRHAEHRRADRAADQIGVPFVVRVRDQRHAAGQQLGPGGRHRHFRAARAAARSGTAADDRERYPEIRSPDRPVLQFSLRDGRAERDVPQGWSLGQVRLAAGKVAQETALRHGLRPLVDGPVLRAPVDRQAQLPPGPLIGPLVQLRQLLAECHEVAPRHRDLLAGRGARLRRGLSLRRGGRLELRVVGQRRIAPDPEVVLHAAFGRQPVVVPPDRVEDFLAAHPLEPRDNVRVRKREDVPEVQGPADG